MKNLIMKSFVLIGLALFSLEGLAQHTTGSANEKELVVTIVVESLVPHENAFDILPSKSSEVYHLENAARMSMAKMRVLNTSLENKSSVQIKVKGTEVIDIIVP